MDLSIRFVISFILSLPLAIVIFGFYFLIQARKDFLELYESATRMVFVQFLAGFLLLATFFSGLLLLLTLVEPEQTLVSRAAVIPLVIVLVYPLPYALFIYHNLERLYERSYKVARDTRVIGEHLELLREVAGKLDLVEWPEICYSALNDISPITYGKRTRAAKLVLPRNFDALASYATGNETDLANNLKRFVFMHELAHIRNGDVALISWAAAFMRSTKYWPFLTLGAAAVALSAQRELAVLVLSMSLLFFFLYTFLHLVIKLTQRHREYLADARVWLYGPDETIAPLLKPSVKKWAEGMTVLEAFFAHLRPQPLVENKWTGRLTPALTESTSSPTTRMKWLEGISRFFFSQHPSAKDRQKALQARKHVNEDRQYPSLEASIVAGIAYSLWCVVAVVASRMLASVLVQAFGFDKESMETSRHRLSSLLGLFSSLLPGLTFLSPIFHSTGSILRTSDALMILGRYIVLTLAAGVSATVFFGVISFPLPSNIESVISPMLIVTANLLYWLPGILFAAAAPRVFTLGSHNKRTGVSMKPIWLYLGPLLISISYIAFLPLQHGTSFVAAMEVFALVGIVWLGLLYPILALPRRNSPLGFAGLTSEEVLFIRRRRTTVFLPLKYPFIFVLLMNLQLLLLIFLPPIIIFHVLSPIIPISSIDAGSLVTTTGVPVFLIVMIELIILSRQLSKRPIPWEVHAVLHLYKSIFQQATNNTSQITRRILNNRFDGGGFYYSRSNLTEGLEWWGDMEHTYYSVLALAKVGHDLGSLGTTLEWVLQCERTPGGFARHWHPANSSRLQSTYHALNILKVTGSLERISASKHRDWILSCRTAQAGFRSPRFSSSALEDTFCALLSLELLCATYKDKALAQWIRYEWRKSRKDVRTTYYVVSALAACDTDFESFKGELQRNWYYVYERRFLASRPDLQWEEIYLFSEISNLLGIALAPQLTDYIRPEVHKTICKLVQ
jgi:Zn-dependent protease with chaperone function